MARKNEKLCPATALLAWLVKWGKRDGPLFQFHSGASLTCSSFVLHAKHMYGQLSSGIAYMLIEQLPLVQSPVCVHQMR